MSKVLNHRKDFLKPCLHPSYLRLIQAYLHQQELIKPVDPFNQLISSEQHTNFATVYHWVKKALLLTEKPWLALEVHSILQPATHGILSLGALCAPNLTHALQLLELAMPLRQRLLTCHIHTDKDFVYLQFEPEFELDEIQVHICITLLGIIYDLIEVVLGDHPFQIQGDLPFKKPSWSQKITQAFPQLNLIYDANALGLKIPEALMKVPCLTADPNSFRLALNECQQQIQQQKNGSLSAQVYQYLYEIDPPYPNQSVTAQHFNMSERTLARKLQQESNQYRTIVDQIRQTHAQWLLNHTDLTVEQVAFEVGYPDANNFSRTFKRWCGMTPSQYRTEQSIHS